MNTASMSVLTGFKSESAVKASSVGTVLDDVDGINNTMRQTCSEFALNSTLFEGLTVKLKRLRNRRMIIHNSEGSRFRPRVMFK